MSKRRVVVTGLGMLSPIGNDVATSWKNALAGKSGAARISSFDASNYSVQISAAVDAFDPEPYLDKKDQRRMDPFIQYGMVAGIQAIQDAGLPSHPDDADRYGLAIGSGIGGINTIEQTHTTLLNKGPNRVSPFFVPASVINMISGYLSIRFGYKGPNVALVTACTTGTHNIGIGMRMIQYGDADVMVVGGAEQATSPITVAAFASMKALSTRNDEPEKASRPWDKDRDGFLLGDGAGVLVLEEYERARARGANIYCELAGFGMSGDAYHFTGPTEDGEGSAASMRNALKDAGMDPQDVDYINAHSTSTPLGDVSETKGIKRIFGADTRIPVNSTKSMIGHLLGAAGSVEAIFTILSIRDQVLHPTINLDNPGEGCDLDFVPHTARDAQVQSALSNSFGFGGTNGTLLFRRI